MITRIFDKSRPINFLIVLAITLLAFVLTEIKLFEGIWSLNYLFSAILRFLLCLLTMALVNFIVSKNQLTKKSSYKILFFSLFFAMVPNTMLHLDILVSNLFVLFALRRIISLKSLIKVKNKLLDASILIAIGSFFHFWSILFLLLIFAALLFYSENKLKNWIVPFIGLATVAVIAIAFEILRSDTYGNIAEYVETADFNYENYNSLRMIIAITIFLSFGLWASVFYVKSIKKKLKTFRPSFVIILIMALLAVFVAALSPNKNGSEMLFLFAPLSIIITNYIEVIEEMWFKEALVAILLVIPIAFQFF